jgi:hypothetical protein
VRPVFRGWRSRSWVAASLSVVLFGAVAVPALTGARAAMPAVKSAAKTSMKPGTNAAATVAGTLEICKSGSHGMAGRTFQFSVNGAAPTSIAGGACSGPLSVASGNVTVTEAPTNDTKVAGIRSNHLISQNLATGTAVVVVAGASTPATETVVTFFNGNLPVLGLKVCKAADPSSGTLVGNLFSFTENGGPAFSVATGTVAAPICGPLTKYAKGTNVDIAELPTTMTHVSAITVSDGRGSNVDLEQGTVTAKVGAGVTTVTFTNAINPIPQFGYVTICKDAAGPFVQGDFGFTITAPNFQLRQTVLVGQCTATIQVPAGPVDIAESASAHYAVSSITGDPADRLVAKNKVNGTATVDVPVGDSSTATQVHFTNRALTGEVKVCKTLSANSGDLQGSKFTFKLTSPVLTRTLSVTAGAAGTTACALKTTKLPLGAAVSITEVAQENVQNVAVNVSPANRDTGGVSGIANLEVGTGATTATFTNEAFGTVEVCKNGQDASTDSQTFEFTVNGGAPISVHAGQCSPAISVPAGTATVAEVAKPNFQFVGVTALGGQQDNRLTTGPTTNPAIVSVPFGGVESETVVTFTNAVVTGQLKICKVSTEPTLQGVTFDFTYSYSVNGVITNGTAALTPGSCSGLSADIPVVDAAGDPIPISIAEAPSPSALVSNIAVANGTLIASNILSGTSTVSVNMGVTDVTYTNVRSPFGTVTVCEKAADASTAGRTFQFAVNGGAPFSVLAGSCAPATVVLAGTATVQEVGSTNFHLVGITAAGPLDDNRLTTGPTVNPATVTVPSGDSSNTTTVTFTDAVDTGQLEICKASSEPSLANATFNFEFQYSANGSNVSGNAALMPGECSTPAGAVPVVDSAGNPIPIQLFEDASVGVDVSNIAVDNGTLTGSDPSAGSTTAFVSQGLTKVTFTNVLEPPRTLFVCKAAADPSTAAQSFQFSVNGGAAFSVTPGSCSAAIVLPTVADTASVQEVASTNFHLVGVAAVGPGSVNRLSSGPTDNPAVVSVPFGGTANPTAVTFTDAVDTGQLEICKASAEPTLQSTTFNFAYSYTVNGVPTNGTAALTPGQCSDPSGAIPVVDATGTPIAVTISETASAGVVVSAITADSGVLSGSDLAAGTTTANVGPGLMKVTFTNALAPLPPG